jgi:hypothetical protein
MGPIARTLGVLISILSLASPSLARPHRWRNLVLAGALAPDPSNPGTLYICSGTTLFRSTDSGADWTITGILAGGARALAADPTSSGTLFAANVDGLFKSTDAGFNWALVNSGSPTTPDGFYGVEVLPGTPVRVFAFAYSLSSGFPDGVYESTDGGGSWGVLDVTIGVTTQIAADPFQPSTLYAAAQSITPAPSETIGGDLYKSEDDGASWTLLISDYPSGSISVSGIAIDPTNSSTLYAAAETGLLRSQDGGLTWAALAGGLPSGAMDSVLLNPNNPQWIYVGTDTGVFRTFDGGVTWSEMIAGWPVGFSGHDLFISGGNLYASTAVGEFAWDLTADTCAPNATTLCLNDERFLVQAQWTDHSGNSGAASVVPNAVSTESGVLWFFGPDNWELLIKVLDGCGVNGHYWVFGAAATDVAYVIQVTDTLTGEVRTYINPLGTRSPAITDTGAFESCP